MKELSINEINHIAGGVAPSEQEESSQYITIGERWNQDTKDYYDAMQQNNFGGYVDMFMLSIFGRVDYGQIYG